MLCNGAVQNKEEELWFAREFLILAFNLEKTLIFILLFKRVGFIIIKVMPTGIVTGSIN